MRESIFAVAPEPLNRLKFRGIGREEDRHDVIGQFKRFGFVERAVIEQEDVKGMGEGFGELIDENLKGSGIEVGQLQKKALSGGRCHRPIEVKAFKAITGADRGMNAPCSEAMAHNRQQPHPTFILGEDAHLAVALLGGGAGRGGQVGG